MEYIRKYQIDEVKQVVKMNYVHKYQIDKMKLS